MAGSIDDVSGRIHCPRARLILTIGQLGYVMRMTCGCLGYAVASTQPCLPAWRLVWLLALMLGP
jgi:hypothetical protein